MAIAPIASVMTIAGAECQWWFESICLQFRWNGPALIKVRRWTAMIGAVRDTGASISIWRGHLTLARDDSHLAERSTN